jgi:hypothetical protein
MPQTLLNPLKRVSAMSLGIHSEVDSQRRWVDLLLEITLVFLKEKPQKFGVLPEL